MLSGIILTKPCDNCLHFAKMSFPFLKPVLIIHSHSFLFYLHLCIHFFTFSKKKVKELAHLYIEKLNNRSEEPDKKKKKLDRDDYVRLDFDPHLYIRSKIMCIGFNAETDIVKEGFADQFIRVCFRSTAASWHTDVIAAPIGSILQKPNDVTSEAAGTGYGNFASSCFVKTKMLQEAIDIVTTSLKEKKSDAKFLHGNSGIGKTHSLDMIAEIGRRKNLLVIHFYSGRYNDLWSYDYKGKGGWKRLFLRQVRLDNSVVLLRSYFRLPPVNPGEKPKLDPSDEENPRSQAYRECIFQDLMSITPLDAEKPKRKSFADVTESTWTGFWNSIIDKGESGISKGARKMVLMVIDDINCLEKGETKTSSQTKDRKVKNYRKDVGAEMLKLIRYNDTKSNCKFANGRNYILFAAASQHYRCIQSFAVTVHMNRMPPPTTSMELLGFCLFFSAILRETVDCFHLTTKEIVKALLAESGVVVRNIVAVLGSSIATAKEMADSGRNDRESFVEYFISGLKEVVRTAIQTRYQSVFRMFYVQYRDDRKLLKDYKDKEVDVKKQHSAFVEDCLSIFRKNIFYIEKDYSPYFDTGLIIESPTKRRFYGFISHLVKTLFGSQIFETMKSYSAHLKLCPEDGVCFERRVTQTLMINGLDLRNVQSYVYGSRAELPDIPIPSYEFNLKFTYFLNCAQRDSNHPEETLKQVQFKVKAEEEQFRNWFQKKALYSRSVMLTSTYEGSQMPVFNNIIITQLFTNAARSTQVTAIQSSLEDHGEPKIKASRFEAFVNNGRKLVESILQMLDPSYTVRVENTPEKTSKQYTVYNQDKEDQNIHVNILYLCIQNECRGTNQDELDVFVLPKGYVLNHFLIEWTGKPSHM